MVKKLNCLNILRLRVNIIVKVNIFILFVVNYCCNFRHSLKIVFCLRDLGLSEYIDIVWKISKFFEDKVNVVFVLLHKFIFNF